MVSCHSREDARAARQERMHAQRDKRGREGVWARSEGEPLPAALDPFQGNSLRAGFLRGRTQTSGAASVPSPSLIDVVPTLMM
eukprot:SAG11_NODE_6036_length_1405_cov_1.493874_2_plen_83_part_00